MAAPNVLLLSSKGGVNSLALSAHRVAGSRRKGPTKKSKSCAPVRAGFFTRDDDFENEEESSSSSSSSLAGKAVSAVVAAAISLSSAGQAAVASSSQINAVSYAYLSHNGYIFLFLKHQRKIGSLFSPFGYDFICETQ